ncbi:hypothetical protein BDN72DRAFT_406710 [Pluteus cervinus]|uniref:Uncharacterized protein n=1 Tax=Pluteus cervinus TaxID=181527 RepID=A0ACD3A8A0_9AGAR|nr:hypothetical protein BDN72DRAFT_406710 [Pluteus cervinus]
MCRASKEPEPISRASSLSKPNPTPQSIELKSGWDEMLDGPKKGLARIIPRSMSPTSSSKSRSPSPRQSPRQSAATEEDAAFMASTLSYLGSPPARTLGLSPTMDRSALLSPPPMHSPARRSMSISSTPVAPPMPAAPLPAVPRIVTEYTPKDTLRHSAQDDASSFAPSSVTSMLDSPWPAPPPSPPTPTASPRDSPPSPTSRSPTPQSSGGRARRERSGTITAPPTSAPARRERSGTITSPPPPASAPARINTRQPAAIEALDSPQSLEFGYPLTPTVTPPQLRARPFLGSTVPAASNSLPLFTLPVQNSRSNRGEITPTGGVRPLLPKKGNGSHGVATKQPSVKSLHQRLASGSSTRSTATNNNNEVIYMTVVKETV